MIMFLFIISLLFMMQICYSSDHKHEYNTQKKEEHKWANAETFISSFSQDMILDSNTPHFNMENRLLKEKMSQNWTNKDLFTVNKIVKNEEEQRLKEYLISNFNAFIDHASSLDYLEIEIPGKVLNYLSINIDDANFGPHVKIVCPNASLDPFHLYISGYNEDGSYALFSGNEFQFNNNENCELITNFVLEKKWQKLFKLNGKHKFKFKFYFQQYGQNHQVVFGGQTFSFKFFEFSLRNPSSKKTSLCTIAEFGYYQIKEKAYIYTPSPKSFVKTLEGMSMIFKFTFYLSNNFYDIYSPLESFQSNYYEQESFFEEYDGFEQKSFFQENIFDEENSIVEITEDTNLEIFEKPTFPLFINLENKSKYGTIECANFYKSLLSKTDF